MVPETHSLIRLFATHRLAANLTMCLMVIAGIWAVSELNVGLNPVMSNDGVNVSISWRGASAEDVEKLITNPIEQQLKSLPDVKSLRSTTQDGWVSVSLQLEPGSDVQKSVDDAKQRIAQIRSFPAEIDPPIISAWVQDDLVAAVLIRGQGTLEELIPLAKRFESELLARGADIVDFMSLPRQEIAVQVSGQRLYELGMSMPELGRDLSSLSQDSPGGVIGSGQASRQIRSLDQRRDPEAFEALPIHTRNGNDLIRLGDIASVEKRTVRDDAYATVNGNPAIQLMVRQRRGGDALSAAEMLHAWKDSVEPSLPAGVSTHIFLEAWVFIKTELDMIFRNGGTGLILVILALLLFLQLRLAFWVMVGIPVTFAAALLAFYFAGGSINAISLIGVVMALGIVVDDAIVVGEESLTQFHAGKSPTDAASIGASKMFAPVVASSLTTLCAFIPILAQQGQPIVEIPLLMLCVIGASLVECFLILPGHMRHAFEQSVNKPVGAFRRRFNEGFEHFREYRFRPLVRMAMENRRIVIGSAFSLFVLMLSLWTTGWIKTELSLNVDFDEIRADVQFVGGSTEDEKHAFIAQLENKLTETDEAFGDSNLNNHVTIYNTANINNEQKSGSQFASIQVELVSPELRDISAERFASEWRNSLDEHAAVESVTIRKPTGYWSDFSILLKGNDTAVLKQAGVALITELGSLEGVTNLRDDLPYGKEQWVFRLTTEGRSLGLTTAEVGRQLRAAYDGERIQIFQDHQREMEVRLLLPEQERTDLGSLGQFPIKTPSGEMLPLGSVAEWTGQRGIDVIRHHDTERTVRISGDVDLDVITGREVVNYFNDNVRDRLQAEYGVGSGLDGKSLAEQESGSDFLMQFAIALTLIYIVLAWIFSSYTWPLAIMTAIPLGLTGAILGHLLMGLHINPMSMLGLFTLTGIIVNDSIILVSAYKNLVEQGVDPQQAIEDAVCSRLRAVILTSVTTVAGLFPLMLEQAPIAAAFTPLAAAICFGMIYGTVLVLLVIPALLSSLVSLTDYLSRNQLLNKDSDYEIAPATHS